MRRSVLSHKGFTLLELLIVVAIIGILTSIFIASQTASREKAQNTAVKNQVAEYAKALELEYTDNRRYPSTGGSVASFGRASIFCFGDGAVGSCLPGASAAPAPVTSQIVLALRRHISALPTFDQTRGGVVRSSSAYSGCTDPTPSVAFSAGTSSCTPADYSLWFMLKGTDQDCGRAEVANANVGGQHTLCRLQAKNLRQ